MGAGIAQLVEHPTESQEQYWRGFESPVRQGIFLPQSASSADSLSLTVSVQPSCTMACINDMCAR